MPGDDWNKAAGLRALLAYMWAHPGKHLLFMGGEFGHVNEWSEGRPLDWDLLDHPLHAGVHALVRDLNAAYRSHPALYVADTRPEGFCWIDANDWANNVLSFLRLAPGDAGEPELACIANFAGLPHHNYRVGLPRAGRWREIINTDAPAYGGSGVGNLGAVDATDQPWHGQPASAVLQLPPQGVLWLLRDE
jgi:1,4-alpha-glucan branching enzyme